MHRTFKLINLTYKQRFTYMCNLWRNAGHSKWQNIRHIKAEKDGERAAIFVRLRRLMEVAVNEGKSADPSSNLQLAQVIQQAKKANMPNATINDTIKTLKAKIENSGSELKIIEISGPAGSAFVICALTPNIIDLKNRIKTIIKKTKGLFSVGTIAHLFDCKCVIQTDFPEQSTLEDAVNVAIELEIEDVIEVNENDESFLQFTGTLPLIDKLKTQLESRTYKVRSVEVIYIPMRQVLVSDEVLESVNSLYNKLDILPEIVNIFDNIVWPEDSEM